MNKAQKILLITVGVVAIGATICGAMVFYQGRNRW